MRSINLLRSLKILFGRMSSKFLVSLRGAVAEPLATVMAPGSHPA